MRIHKSEQELKDVILTANKSCMSVKLNLNNKPSKDVSIASILDEITDNVSAVDLPEDKHPDLLYGSSILVSTNMNGNDDIFLPQETFAAKDTPVNTPFNLEHESSEIIGHIISSVPIDENGEIVNSINSDQDLFDIEVGFVIYKFIYPELAASIVTLASIGQQFVSMECILEDFDYGLVDADGGISVVERNESTAFLTKHLRRFGGDGKYEDKQVGRVLRDIRFVGMGSVSEPANPTSKYTQFKVLAKNEELVYESEGNRLNNKDIDEGSLQNEECLLITAKGNVMKIENLDQALEKIQSLEDEKQSLASDLDSAKAEKTELEQAVTDVTTERDSTKTELETAQAELDAEKQKVDVAEQEIASLNEKVETGTQEAQVKEQELVEATTKVQEFESAKVLAERISEFESLGFSVSDEKMEDLKNMSDEVYASTLEWMKSIRKSDETTTSNTNVSELEDVVVEQEVEIVNVTEEADELNENQVAASLVSVLRAKANKSVK